MTQLENEKLKALKNTAHKVSKTNKSLSKILTSIGGYFKGSWRELRQVRWPDNKSAWGMTVAVILFTAFFVVLIALLDIGFKQLFELILK